MTRVAAGMSGAAVYRVERGGEVLLLKIGGDHEPVAQWRERLATQRLAAAAGLAPRVVHSDEVRRAVTSAFVVDQSFARFYRDPATHEVALERLGQLIARTHALPIPAGAAQGDLRPLLTTLGPGAIALPAFAQAAIERMRDEVPPQSDRALVASHNDMNPSNLAYDGADIVLLDWDSSGPNDPYYDLATVATFLRMTDATCLRLLSAYDGAPIAALPARFSWSRRFVAALAGSACLAVACRAGHAGDGAATSEATLGLAEFYQLLQTGAVSLRDAAGQWQFGLALLKASLASGTTATRSTGGGQEDGAEEVGVAPAGVVLPAEANDDERA